MSSIQLLKREAVVFIRSKNLPEDVMKYVSEFLPKMVSPFKKELAFFHHHWESFKNLVSLDQQQVGWEQQLENTAYEWTKSVCQGMDVSNTFYSRSLALFTYQFGNNDLDMDTDVWDPNDSDQYDSDGEIIDDYEGEKFTHADAIKRHLAESKHRADYLLKEAKKPFCPQCRLVRGHLAQSDGTSWCLQCLTEFILN